MYRLETHIDAIAPLDRVAMSHASVHHTRLAKAPGSMGRLEDIAVRLAGITGRVKNQVKRRRIIVLCADNGVTEEGVSLASQSVTAAQAVNLAKGGAGTSAMAQYFGAELQVVDVGITGDCGCPAILERKVRRGTHNFTKQPAMSEADAVNAILVGIDLARQAKDEGVDIIGVGDVGPGNATAASAVLSALTGMSAETVLEYGKGYGEAKYVRKKRVIQQAMEAYQLEPNRPVDILAKVGGLSLAAMCGVYLGAAEAGLPVVMDGFASAVAALCAVRLCPTAAQYLFASHASQEPGYHLVMRELDLAPYLQLDMWLGEGSGCPLTFEIIAAACAVMQGMATFEEADIDDSYLSEVEEAPFAL